MHLARKLEATLTLINGIREGCREECVYKRVSLHLIHRSAMCDLAPNFESSSIVSSTARQAVEINSGRRSGSLRIRDKNNTTAILTLENGYKCVCMCVCELAQVDFNIGTGIAGMREATLAFKLVLAHREEGRYRQRRYG